MKDLELLKMFICGTRTMKDVDPKTVEIWRSFVDGQRKFKYFQLMGYIDFLHSYIEKQGIKE